MFHSDRKPSFCLVLSGGGAKGVYHIGAWRALKEMGIQVDAFIGNSIGAIMAGFLAQGKDRELEEIGNNIGVDFIMKVPDELIENGELKISKGQLPVFRSFYHNIMEKKGIDVSPMRNMIHEHLDEKKLRANGNDLGVVTFNISDLKPQETFLEEMDEGTVLDYLMASAAFPGLEQTVIKGKKFIDGGVYDNIPYSMARARGYRNIIVVDISGMGINRRPEVQGAATVYIKNSINMGGVFDFNREFLNRFRLLGYLDTLKTFGVLKGQKYFIEPDRRMEKQFRRILESDRSRPILDDLRPEEGALPGIPSEERLIRLILPEEMRKDRNVLYNLADCGAAVFGLDRIRKYTVREILREMGERKRQDDEKIASLMKSITKDEKVQQLKKLDVLFSEASKPDSDQESPWYYYRLVTHVFEQAEGSLLMKGLYHFFPELPGGRLFQDLMN